MQLRTARLCLDCDEVHNAQVCPVCTSEAFAYLTRWVPAHERRMRPRPTTSPEAEVFHDIVSPADARSKRMRFLARSTAGVTALAVAGWIWRKSKNLKQDVLSKTSAE